MIYWIPIITGCAFHFNLYNAPAPFDDGVLSLTSKYLRPVLYEFTVLLVCVLASMFALLNGFDVFKHTILWKDLDDPEIGRVNW